MDEMHDEFKPIVAAPKVRRSRLTAIPHPKKVPKAIEMENVTVSLCLARGKRAHPCEIEGVATFRSDRACA